MRDVTDDPGDRQILEDLRLAPESLHDARILGRETLQRHRPPRREIARFVHRAHAARARGPDDLEPPFDEGSG
jgi:hypothetical protein